MNSRLVFGPAAVRALKEIASLSIPNPTRAQVVSAHLSKCIMPALEAKSGCKKRTLVSHMVNLRGRADQGRFPEELIGNLVCVAVVPRVSEDDDLVKQIREATAKIDGDLVERMIGIGDDKVFQEQRYYSGAASGNGPISFTSRCNMGMYEADFGWGKPIWVSNFEGPPIGATMMLTNLVVLTDKRSRDGVEAYLFLDEGDLAFLERNQDLLAYAAFDQSLLHGQEAHD